MIKKLYEVCVLYADEEVERIDKELMQDIMMDHRMTILQGRMIGKGTKKQDREIKVTVNSLKEARSVEEHILSVINLYGGAFVA